MAVESYEIFAGGDELPEGCLANALSLTSPKDACRLSLVASTFRSAAESDAVWERFLPPDYGDIISRSIDGPDSLAVGSKKELYLHLCDHPILIDGGSKVINYQLNDPLFLFLFFSAVVFKLKIKLYALKV